MSPEFDLVWSQPFLVDCLIEIHEQRQAAQGERDTVAAKAMHLIDALATITANQGRKEGEAVRWMSEELFAKVKRESFEEQQRKGAELIARGVAKMEEMRKRSKLDHQSP